MDVAIVKYNAGNTFSVQQACLAAGAQAVITDDVEVLKQAPRVIFPGVGHASSAMQHLHATGLAAVLAGLQQPLLGICLGMQLLAESSEEGDATGLGLVPGRVLRFPDHPGLTVPLMGWCPTQHYGQGLFRGIAPGAHFYYVHSYYLPPGPHTTATALHGLPFTAALALGNKVAVQFHPEKSGAAGITLLQNFFAL